MNGLGLLSPRMFGPLPDTAAAIAKGWIKVAPAPEPKPKHRRIDYPSYKRWLAIWGLRRARNIAAGLRWDGKPRTRAWSRIQATTKAEHDAIDRERRLSCQRRKRDKWVAAGLTTLGKPRKRLRLPITANTLEERRLEANRRGRVRYAVRSKQMLALGLTAHGKARKRPA